jgi:hypothetical protein
MDERLSFNLRQLIFAIVLIILFTAAFTLTIFWLGQENALRKGLVVEESTSSSSAVQTLQIISPQSTLPHAMTATPKIKTEQQYILTEEQVTQLVMDQIQASSSQTMFKVNEVDITNDALTLSGYIDYMDYSGNLDIDGVPVVEHNKLRFQLNDAKLDGQDLPQFLYPMIEEEINDIFDKTLFGYDVSTVELEDGVLILTILPW